MVDISSLKTEITKIHYDKNAKGFFVSVLEFASLFYGLGSGCKNFLYDKNILSAEEEKAFIEAVKEIICG